jgi:hypothetical protein
MEVPDPPEILVEDKVQTRSVVLVVSARVTVPVKPLRGATDMVEVPLAPALNVPLVGLPEMVKSGDDDCATETYTVAE